MYKTVTMMIMTNFNKFHRFASLFSTNLILAGAGFSRFSLNLHPVTMVAAIMPPCTYFSSTSISQTNNALDTMDKKDMFHQ